MELIRKYDGGGYLMRDSWKADSDRLFGSEEAVSVWKSLIRAALVPPTDRDLLFVSPTAAQPTHEFAIWEFEVTQRTGRARFLAGDIREISLEDLRPKRQAVISESGRTDCSFDYFRWDAERLPIREHSVDVLWDRKGWLWHCSRNFKEPERLRQSCQSYYDLLSPGGCLVVDSIDGFDDSIDDEQRRKLFAMHRSFQLGVIKGFRPSELLDNPPFQYEHSTVDVMTDCDPGIWDYLADFFKIQDIGEGVSKVRVMVKSEVKV